MTCIDGGNKGAGTNCGTNQVCDGNGMCVNCTAGGGCTTNPSICKNGTTACATGAMTCVDGGNKSAGTGCGTNLVCNGAGACVSCTSGGVCTGNPNMCKTGVYACTTGAMTCADGSNKPGGTSCGTNLVCDGNGNCGSCTPGQSCTNNPNPCYTGVTSCTTGAAVCLDNTLKPPGTNCGTNRVCNSTGTCVACTTGLSCTTNPGANSCKLGVTSCTSGAQVCIDGGTAPNSTSCSDGDDCSSGDTCVNGTCFGAKYSCYATACQSSSVCDGTGGCRTQNAPDGQSCGYPDDCPCCSCPANGTCSGGICHYKSCCSTQLCCCNAAQAQMSASGDTAAMIICPL